jgi:hypothetical protein
LENAKKLANALDCPSSNKAFLVKCLQRIDAGKLLEQTISDDVLVSLLWRTGWIEELVNWLIKYTACFKCSFLRIPTITTLGSAQVWKNLELAQMSPSCRRNHWRYSRKGASIKCRTFLERTLMTAIISWMLVSLDLIKAFVQYLRSYSKL